MPKVDKRDWCFTLNCVEAVKTDMGMARQTLEISMDAINKALSEKVNYMVVGFEIGEETNHPHLQGFFQLKESISQQKLKRIDKRIHWELRKGTPQQAADYCKEDGVIICEYGTLQERVKPVSFDDFMDAIKANKDVFAPEYLKYHLLYGPKITSLIETIHPDVPIKTKPYVEWRYGPTGVGKSRPIREMECLYEWTWHSPYQDYNNQKIILFDDFDETELPFRQLLRLLDYGSVKVRRMYKTAIWLKPTHIYITCEHHPSQLYKGKGNIAQLLRRIDAIVHIVK